VTYSLVKTSTFCLTSEITNRSTALTRDLVGGLSEVFCLTNPEQADNPIVYASQEFYRLTGYHKDNVIGYNCRFLQGPGTKRESVERLKSAIKNGEEISEALLNYRRDGKPFMNVLMLAPLHDDKGKVKYYLGAQVDASRLIEHGRGVEGFERYLMKKEMDSQRQKHAQTDLKQAALDRLRDLSISFDLEESAVVKNSSRSSSRTRVESGEDPTARRRLDDTDSGSDSEDDHLGIDGGDALKLSRDRFSGNLPGIYKKYILLRPYPSL
jgi:PAS domain S-box-containing protein